jgi:hypothetical protein
VLGHGLFHPHLLHSALFQIRVRQFDAAGRRAPAPLHVFLVTTVIGEGFIMSHWHVSRFLPWFWLGGYLVVVGGALMYAVDASKSTACIYGTSVLLGTGIGAYLQLPFAVAQAQAPLDRAANDE